VAARPALARLHGLPVVALVAVEGVAMAAGNLAVARAKALPTDTGVSPDRTRPTRRVRAKACRAALRRVRNAATTMKHNRAHTCRRASRRQACLQAAVATAAVVVAAVVAALEAIAAAVEAAAIAAAARAAVVALVVAATAIERQRP
jgi:hypothetical protein